MASIINDPTFWTPGVAVPHEPICDQWAPKLTTRWFVHANGRPGEASQDIELAAINGLARVLVTTSTSRWYPTLTDQRQRAAQMLVSLPSILHLPSDQIRQMFDQWKDGSLWGTREFVVNTEAVTTNCWTLPTGEWCATSLSGTRVILLAAAHTEIDVLQVRPVKDMKPYGLDLSRRQSASTIATLAADVQTEWESNVTHH